MEQRIAGQGPQMGGDIAAQARPGGRWCRRASIVIPDGRVSFSVGLRLDDAFSHAWLHAGIEAFVVGTAHQKDSIAHLVGCGRNDDHGLSTAYR